MALHAALAYPERLGGVVSISGWSVCRSGGRLRCVVEERRKKWEKGERGEGETGGKRNTGKREGNRDLPALPPVWFSCGTADPEVAFQLAKRSGQALEAVMREGESEGTGRKTGATGKEGTEGKAKDGTGGAEEKGGGAAGKTEGRVTVVHVQRGKHPPKPAELAEACGFMRRCLGEI